MALLERLQIVIEADARTAEREFDRIGRQASESLGSIEDAAGKVGDNAAAELAGASSEFARAGRKLSDAAGDGLDLSAAAREAAADVSRALESQRQEAEQAGRRLGDSAGAGVTAGVRDAGSNVRSAGSNLGDQAGEGVSDGLLSTIGGIGGDLTGALDDVLGALPAGLAGPVAAVGAAVGLALVGGISDAIETENLGDVIAARVGEGAAESERFARVTSDVFRDAWGESTAEVADSVDAVYSTLSESRGSEEALRDLTERAQAFADVFNQDVGQAVSNAGVLIETGLARDAVEAFDLMTAAAQRVPAAMRDELAEATQEYSTFFAALGFDGRESFAILTDAAQEGRYELDKTGDAMKELSIRATDLADTAAMDALEELGLNARNTATDLLEGGEAARVATQQIMTALDGVPDPAKQAEIAIALMGAPLEDLNKQEIPEFIERLAGASDGMQDAAGASDRLTDSLKNQQSSLTILKREALGFFEDFADDALAPAAAIADGETTFQELGTAVGESFMTGLSLTPLGKLAEEPLKFWSDILGVGESVDILGLVMGNTTPAATGDNDWLWERLGLNPGGPDLGLEQIPAEASVARKSLQTVNDEIELFVDLSDLAADRADSYLERISGLSNLDEEIAAQLSLRDAVADLADGLGALQGVDIQGFADGAVQVSDDAADALGDVAGAAAAAQEQIASALEFEGEEAAVAEADRLREQFVGIFEAAGLSTGQINTLLESMGLLPDQVSTAIELSGTEEALAKLDLLSVRFNGENADAIPDVVQTEIDVAIAEGRFVDAANLLSLWVADQTDGYIDNPLLVAMGLGETDSASEAVGVWKRGEEGKPPVRVPVGANTDPARLSTSFLMRDIANLRPEILVRLRVQELAGSFPIFGVGGTAVRGGRAMGGPMLGGTQYEVNERGQELFVSNDGGFMVNASNLRELMDNMERLTRTGSSGGGDVINVYETAAPRQTAAEVIRARNANRFLAGARP